MSYLMMISFLNFMVACLAISLACSSCFLASGKKGRKKTCLNLFTFFTFVRLDYKETYGR